MLPGGARHCVEHGRMECVKNRTKGRGPCHKPAIRGTDTCDIHGGLRREVLKARGQATISAWSAVGKPGQVIEASAAVMGMLQQSWLRANLYSNLLHQQVLKEGGEGAEIVSAEDPDNPSGLIGYRYGAAGKDGHIYAVSEEARGLVMLEAQERDRCVKYAKTAHDMGISDKLIGMAERWGDQVISKIMAVLAGLALSAEQEAKVPALIQAHLSAIEIGS